MEDVDPVDSPNDSLDLKLLFAMESMTASAQAFWEECSCEQYRLEFRRLQTISFKMENDYVCESLVRRVIDYQKILRHIDQFPFVERLYPARLFLRSSKLVVFNIADVEEGSEQREDRMTSFLFRVNIILFLFQMFPLRKVISMMM